MHVSLSILLVNNHVLNGQGGEAEIAWLHKLWTISVVKIAYLVESIAAVFSQRP